jgi:glycosyltransferase involved in cell wall biosynthesis
MVIPYYSTVMGGDVNVCKNLSKKLDEAGYSITILTTDYKIKSEDIVIDSGSIEVVLLKSRLRLGLFFFTPDIFKWIRRNLDKYDLVHLQNYRSFQSAMISSGCEKREIPVVLQPHGNLIRVGGRQFEKKIFDFVWGNKILGNSDRFIVLTEEERGRALNRGISENKITVIANAIDDQKYSVLPRRGIFRDKYNISQEANVIIFLGRLHKLKGLDILLDAFKLLHLKDNNSVLVIAGSDFGYKKNILDTITEYGLENSVVLTGHLNENEKISALVDSDIFTLPSYSEGFPTAVIEAFACGLPVIVSHECGVDDIVKDVAGIVIENNRDNLSNAILYLIENPEIRKKYGEGGKSIVKDRFNWNLILGKYTDIYESLLNR